MPSKSRLTQLNIRVFGLSSLHIAAEDCDMQPLLDARVQIFNRDISLPDGRLGLTFAI